MLIMFTLEHLNVKDKVIVVVMAVSNQNSSYVFLHFYNHHSNSPLQAFCVQIIAIGVIKS